MRSCSVCKVMLCDWICEKVHIWYISKIKCCNRWQLLVIKLLFVSKCSQILCSFMHWKLLIIICNHYKVITLQNLKNGSIFVCEKGFFSQIYSRYYVGPTFFICHPPITSLGGPDTSRKLNCMSSYQQSLHFHQKVNSPSRMILLFFQNVLFIFLWSFALCRVCVVTLYYLYSNFVFVIACSYSIYTL